jgi:hypothetical protein
LVVFVDQPAEYIFTLDPRRRLDALIRVVVRWQLFAALMRAMVVVLRMEDGEYLGRVPVPQDESVVQALSAHGADEPLGVGVRPRSLDRVLMMRKPLEVELALHREWPHPVFALITPLESDP